MQTNDTSRKFRSMLMIYMTYSEFRIYVYFSIFLSMISIVFTSCFTMYLLLYYLEPEDHKEIRAILLTLMLVDGIMIGMTIGKLRNIRDHILSNSFVIHSETNGERR